MKMTRLTIHHNAILSDSCSKQRALTSNPNKNLKFSDRYGGIDTFFDRVSDNFNTL